MFNCFMRTKNFRTTTKHLCNKAVLEGQYGSSRTLKCWATLRSPFETDPELPLQLRASPDVSCPGRRQNRDCEGAPVDANDGQFRSWIRGRSLMVAVLFAFIRQAHFFVNVNAVSRAFVSAGPII